MAVQSLELHEEDLLRSLQGKLSFPASLTVTTRESRGVDGLVMASKILHG